jgi:hypothetical protein
MAASGSTPISLYYSVTTTNAPLAANLVNGELAINITDGNLYYKDNANVVQIIANKNATAGIFSGTGAITIPRGTTAQQPSPATQGMLRFNTNSVSFEGYNGTAWTPVGGASIVNDTSTATALYPIFTNVTSGAVTTVNTSNANLLYTPSTGALEAKELVANNGIFVNNTTINYSYTISAGYAAHSIGPITISGGVTVTVPSGSRWLVL